MSLGKLKDHERLLIWRLRNNKTQAQAARKFRMTPARYAAMELGRREMEVDVFTPINSALLAPHERCLLYRRRTNMSQECVAKKLRCSRYWVNRMERGLIPCDALLWFWEQ